MKPKDKEPSTTVGDWNVSKNVTENRYNEGYIKGCNKERKMLRFHHDLWVWWYVLCLVSETRQRPQEGVIHWIPVAVENSGSGFPARWYPDKMVFEDTEGKRQKLANILRRWDIDLKAPSHSSSSARRL